jgi:hypothetical protein
VPVARSLPPSPLAPSAQLAGFIARFPPPIAKLTKAVLEKMRTRLPGAVELVYDKANALAIGFGPDERASNIIVSIATYSKWINLYFFEGDRLPDPQGLLQGTGTMVRHIRINEAADLDRPAVKALMSAALRAADPPLDRQAKRRMVIKQVSRGTRVGAW